MRKTILSGIALSLILAMSAPALAQSRSGLGVGIETPVGADVVLPYPPGITVTYDTGSLYAGGIVGFYNQDNTITELLLGGRAYVVIHDGDQSDFAVGGGINLFNANPEVGESDTSFLLHLGGNIRYWMSGNVSATAGLGLSILVADDGGPLPNDNAVGLLGHVMGNLGISYYFW